MAVQKASFAAGCFWGVEYVFSKFSGVTKTDVGNQYRSEIFYYNEEQKKEAENAKKDYEKLLGKKVVTKIEKAGKFYSAEDYHQKYYEKKGSEPYCHIVPRVS